jgi:fibronectin-binding autotransporter adhesin
MRRAQKISRLMPAVLLALGGVKASAQVLYEPFNYNAPIELDATVADPNKNYSTQGTYWAQRDDPVSIPTDTTKTNTTTPGTPTYMLAANAPVLPAAQGNAVRLLSTNTGFTTPTLGFGQYIQSGDIYWSMTVKTNALPSSTNGGYVAGINSFAMPGNNLSTRSATMSIRKSPTDATKLQIGLSNATGTSPGNTTWSADLTQGDSWFVVGKLHIDPSSQANDPISMWVNPASNFGSATEAGGAMTRTQTTDLGDSLTPVSPAHAAFFLRAQSGTGPAYVDELRVDSTWAGVTPDGNLQYTWNSGAGGNLSDTTWNKTVNAPSNSPNGLGHVANFDNTLGAGNPSVTTAGQLLDTINFKNAVGITINGTGFTVKTNASAGQLVAYAGNNTVTAPIIMDSNLAVKAVFGASVTLPSSITGLGGAAKTLYKYGQGSVLLSASNGIADNTRLEVRTGPLDLNGFSDTVDTVVLGAGHSNPSFAINSTPDLATGTISGTGTLTANNYDLQCGTVSASLAGTNGVVKNNQATVILSGNNSYTGTTNITGGVLVLSGTNSNPVTAVINAPISLSNGTQSVLSISDDANMGSVPGGVVANAITIAGSAKLKTTANMTLNANRGITMSTTTPGLIDNAAGTTLSYGGVITGTGGMTQTGGGTINLSGASNYLGATNVVGGVGLTSTLQIGTNNALPIGTTLGLNTLSATGGAVLDLGDASTTGFNQELASIVNNSGANAAPLITNSGTAIRTLTINNASANTWNFPVTANVALTKNNVGKLTLSGVNTYVGGTTVNLGTVEITNNFRKSASLTVADGAATVMTARTANVVKVMEVGTLNLNSSGTLDLNDNDLVVTNGSFNALQSLVFAGYRGGPDTSATGIVSTTSQTVHAGTTILALFDNAQAGFGDWPVGSGSTVSGSAIIGKYTYIGDTNMDGQVTPQDYTATDSNLGTSVDPAISWFYGDTNFDGNIDPTDYAGIDGALGLGQGNPLAVNGLAAVPEPTSLSLVGLGAVGMLGRRRRKA